MSRYRSIEQFFDSRRDYGVLMLRLVIGWRLIDGTQDNIFSWERMLEFRDFLAAYNVPAPLLAAQVSVYAQFFAGVAIMIGLFIRSAAALMVINFTVALFLVHLGTSFQESFQAIAIWTAAFFFLFYGGGEFSMDNRYFSHTKK